jgi:hypothetical protein
MVDIVYGRMTDGQEVAVVAMIKTLIEDYGVNFETNLTADILRENRGLLNVEVAAIDGKVVGLCAWIMTFSTWRGGKGIYLTDHYVAAHAPNRLNVARKLLHMAVRSSQQLGATFVRTERDLSEELMEQLYGEVKFWDQRRQILCFLEPPAFAQFSASEPE